jgi:hypothetical protein
MEILEVFINTKKEDFLVRAVIGGLGDTESNQKD